MRTKDESLQEDLELETGFNDAIDNLRKSLGRSESELRKSKGKEEDEDEESDAEEAEESDAEESEEDEEPEEEEPEDKGKRFKPRMKKSIEDILREEPEAAAAMDVEPFLLQLAKAMDESMDAISKRIGQVERIAKSIGSATIASAELQKSTRDMVKVIGDQPLPVSSVRRLEKARFGSGDDKKEVDTRDILSKSRDWVKTGKIDLIEAGNLEGRINKGLLGKVNDRLDQKVDALLREDK